MASNIISRAVEMSEADASKAFTAILMALSHNVEKQRKITRMRKQLPFNEREAVLTKLTNDWNALNMLREKIGTAFCIGGY